MPCRSVTVMTPVLSPTVEGSSNQYLSPQTYRAVSPCRSPTLISPDAMPVYSLAACSNISFSNSATVFGSSSLTSAVGVKTRSKKPVSYTHLTLPTKA